MKPNYIVYNHHSMISTGYNIFLKFVVLVKQFLPINLCGNNK